ncbi:MULTISPECIES: L,D-transpeptidase family protein [unclassified Streptomyces]|uniref:L,D-transpeptidase family protein n=1 Tax=unclassified Streptomyces TaxID=2593676 RepID=UPI000DBAB056|nr:MULTISPECIES: L,D-transpeptidase family protein [unclassified Streptomyces]MYT68687.1 L,D-transpeptidase family protein [Streptomyces sp. SID8367]RAJ86360.1 putative peptidoglycan binding protein [Streptomyces sp. PsTaAH-137]
MRTAVIRSALAVTGVLALVGGCKAVAVEGGSAAPSSAPRSAAPSASKSTAPPASASGDDAKPSAPGSASSSATAPPEPGKALWAAGDKGQEVRELQARLRQVAWLFDGPTGTYGPATVKAVEGFQGKRGLKRTGTTDTVTWQRLLRMTHEPTRDELYASGGQPAAKPDPRCMTGRVLCISKTSRTLSWMIDGKRLMTTDVRFGSQYTPTREGVFHVDFKSRDHVSTIYHTPMPYAMFFSGGQAVHYSSDFAARGYAGASHGCVNVRDKAKIASLFDQVRAGDKVVVYW